MAETHYETAERLTGAYKEALATLNAEGVPKTDAGWRESVYAQRNVEALLANAQVHATLAVADAIRGEPTVLYDGSAD